MNKDLLIVTLGISLIIILVVSLIDIIAIKRNKKSKSIIYKDKPVLNYNDIEILEMYESSGIKIPYDIIEELEYRNFDNREDVEKFIEIQRNSWKLENSKKPFK